METPERNEQIDRMAKNARTHCRCWILPLQVGQRSRVPLAFASVSPVD